MPIWGDPASAGKQYEPSNGTEGHAFIGRWCENCERDKVMNGEATVEQADVDDTLYCSILSNSFLDGGVAEWIFDAKGMPTCTAFVPKGDSLPVPRCPHTAELPGIEPPPEAP
jgi:hypothetical protein